MTQKWNLQDIRPPQQRRKRGAVISRAQNSADIQIPERESELVRSYPEERIQIQDGNKKRSFGYIIAIAVFVFVIASGFVASAFMSGAEITVYPKNRTPNVNAEFTAYQTAQPGELTYELMSLEATGERQVTASGEEEVEEQATGEIEIVKTTPGAQRLITNTRFESPGGLIFKITESVIVPGAVNGTPGTIRAEVYSDGTGEEYNLAPTRFTVPGLASDRALFESIYAESARSFTGGFSGPRFSINESELQTATQGLQIELRDTLLARLPNEKPAGFAVFDDAVSITYESLPPVQYGDDLVTIKEKATLQVPIFKADDFAEYLAAATIPGYEMEPVRIDNQDALTFQYTSATTSSSDLTAVDEIEFRLSGRPLIVWTYDSGRLKTDLMGAAKTAMPSVLSGYSAINGAEAVVRPFWQRSFPDELTKIKIIEVVEETAGQ